MAPAAKSGLCSWYGLDDWLDGALKLASRWRSAAGPAGDAICEAPMTLPLGNYTQLLVIDARLMGIEAKTRHGAYLGCRK